MRSVRRFYFYLVAFISLEVVLWGLVSLTRTMFASDLMNNGEQIATGLSLVLVGLPILALHWGVAQRDARRDEEERSSRLRAVFLYGVQLATTIPIVYSLMAIVNRPLMSLFSVAAQQALMGAGQTVVDNLVAIVVLSAALVYFRRILAQDWQAGLPGDELQDVRRLYRYIWTVYSLVLLVAGVFLLLSYLFVAPETAGEGNRERLANGIALLLTSAPLWAYTWLLIQRAQEQPAERRSLLRMVTLFLLSLSGAVSVLVSIGILLAAALDWGLGIDDLTLVQFLSQNSGVLAYAIPLATVWAYFDRQLRADMAALPDAGLRAALNRLYTYILALLGLVAVFLGMQFLLGFLIEILFKGTDVAESVRRQLSAGLAFLVVGLPVWLKTWPVMQREARQAGDGGEHARRSILRKGYLYLVLFAAVVGAMASAGGLFYQLLNALLQGAGSDFALDATHTAQTLALVLVWLIYHLTVLLADGRQALRSLSERHAAFAAILFELGEGGFGDEVLHALHYQAPHLPAVVHHLEHTPLEEAPLEASVVVLPAALATHPPEALRLWLNEYDGKRLVVPLPEENWHWLGAGRRSRRDLAKETALAIRQMAEGQPVRSAPPTNPWSIVAYVLGALFGLQLLIMLLMMILGSLFD